MKMRAIMKHFNIKTIRKRGADMTQALLYAAFAIIVLISVLAMYQVVTVNNNKAEASRIMSMISNDLRLTAKTGASARDLTAAAFIARGAVPATAISGEEIRLPYGGILRFNNFGLGDPTIQPLMGVEIYFEEGSRGTTALCTYLSAGSDSPTAFTKVDAGPLGENYMVANYCNPGSVNEGWDYGGSVILVYLQ